MSSSADTTVQVATLKHIVLSLNWNLFFLVFVYGATGAGKTYTMLGSQETPGLTFKTVDAIYNKLEAIKEEMSCEIVFSLLEIYNEQVFDLMQPGKPILSIVYWIKFS